jgi:hypothetical protein
MERSLPVMVVVALALAVLGLGTSVAPGASVAAKTKRCPTVPAKARMAIQLQVTNMSCVTGHKVAARVVRRAPTGCVTSTDQRHFTLVKPCSRLGYRCSGRSIAGGLALSVKCRRGARVLRFQY